MLKTKFISGIAITICLITGIAFAATTLPNHYPSSFEITGTITKVNKKKRVVTLDKADYQLHPVHDIYTHRKNSKTTLYSLKPGMKIGGKFGTYQGKRVLVEIWLLPKDYPTTPHAV